MKHAQAPILFHSCKHINVSVLTNKPIGAFFFMDDELTHHSVK
jgi:hypothetical protein